MDFIEMYNNSSTRLFRMNSILSPVCLLLKDVWSYIFALFDTPEFKVVSRRSSQALMPALKDCISGGVEGTGRVLRT